jgi:hypothetical protein
MANTLVETLTGRAKLSSNITYSVNIATGEN